MGPGLFQNGADLDLESEMSTYVQQTTKDPSFRFLNPDKPDAVARRLNSGLFHTLLERFRAAKWNYWVIYLGALSMQLGVTITEKDMDVLRSTTRKTKMYSRAKEQMQRGMTEYMNNGEGWDFGRASSDETVRLGVEAQKGSKGSGGTFGVMVPEDRDLRRAMASEGPRAEREKEQAGKEEKASMEHQKLKARAPATSKDVVQNQEKMKAWLGGS